MKFLLARFKLDATRLASALAAEMGDWHFLEDLGGSMANSVSYLCTHGLVFKHEVPLKPYQLDDASIDDTPFFSEKKLHL